MIGIIGAMREELELLLAELEEAEEVRVGGYTLFRGRLAGKSVLISQCGVGKVNAAALAQVFVLRGVSQLIFTGVAGALEPGLTVGDIVVSTDAAQHDVDVSALGYALGEVPGEPLSWAADEALKRLALGAAATLEGVKVVAGRVLSGDQFIADRSVVRRLRETFKGSCAEMEGAAVAQVCSRAALPFVIVRSLSDSADGEAVADFRAFTPLAAARAKQVVLEMLRRL